MIKKIYKTAAFLFSIITFTAVISCGMEVGLGSAVDTDVPTVEITYPPKNAIVRSSFVAAGICDDDLALDYVEVTVTNTSTKKVYGPYETSLSEDKKNWSTNLNRKVASGSNAFDAYKQWEFPDGNYIITAVSYDEDGKSSQEASIPVSIDNTAPVLLVSKPLAFGNETASVYGRTLNIIGDISEEHETAKLTLYYKEYNENNPSAFANAETKTLEISGFGTMSSDSPLTIAKYFTNTNQQTDAEILIENYKKIYGNDINIETSKKKLFYCGFLLEDNAKEYKTPGDSGSGSGNETTQYYILSDDYNTKLFSDESGYSLNARNLMLLLNGKSSYTGDQQKKITELLQGTGYSASSTEITAANSSKFSVDPKNNPVWEITNFGFNEETFDTYEPGSAVPLVLKAGGDGIAIDKDSIKIELYYLGSGAAPGVITADTPRLTLIREGEYEDGKLKEALNKDDLKFCDKNGNELSGSIYSGLQINHYYEFKITGQDVSGNEIDPEGDLRYGFRLYSNFTGPRITFESDSSSFKENEFYSGKKIDNDGIIIKGKIVTADTSVTIPDEDSIAVKKITATDISTGVSTTIPFNSEIIDFQSDGSNAGTGNIYKFTAKITKKTTTLAPSAEGSYKYKVVFYAVDSLNELSEDSEFEFKLDTAKPVISENSVSKVTVSPKVNGSVNGKITVSGNVSDIGSGFKQLKYGTGDFASASSTGVTVTGSTWSFIYDTTTLDNKTGNYTLNIYAEDNTENLGKLELPLSVDQNTDKPNVSFTNASSIFTNTNNVLVGNVTDDDGLTKITAAYRKTGPGTPEAEGTEHPISLEGTAADGTLNQITTSFGLNVKLLDASDNPLPEGEYEIIIYAEDKENAQYKGEEIGKKTEKITIQKDNGAPVLKITSPKSTKDTYYNVAVPVKGTVKDGSGKVTFTRKIYTIDSNGNILQELANTVDKENVRTWTIEDAGIYSDSGYEWSDTIPQQENGTYMIVYTAKDKYATNAVDDTHTSTQSVIYSVDKTIPKIETVKLNNNLLELDENGESRGWLNKNYGEFTVTASDNKRVTSVSYSQDNVQWSNMASAEGSWSANVTFVGTDAEKPIYIKATDIAGNDSIVKSFKLKTDINPPSLEFTGLSGIVYVNNKENAAANAGNAVVELTVSNYSDGTDESGTKPLKFDVGTTPINATVDGTTYKFNKKDIPDSDIPLTLKVTGEDIAGNTVTKDICSFIVDTQSPVINANDLTLVMVKGTGDNASKVSAYKNAAGNYYIRNTKDGNLTISGTVTDDYYDRIELKVNGAAVTGVAPATVASWSFTNIDLSDKTDEATITLTAYDKAGNGAETEKTITVKFDEIEPEVVTGEYTSTSYTFREKTVTKYGLLNIGGGSYSETSYGRDNALDFSVILKEEDSGIARLEYKLFAVSDTVAYTDDNSALKASLITQFKNGTGIWTSSGSFDLTPDYEYNVYGVNEKQKGVLGTASISGFKATSGYKTNFLIIRPVDNCGNYAQEPTILAVNIDQTVPKIVAVNSEKLTNGTKAISLNGSVYDIDAGLKAMRVLIDNTPVIDADLTGIEVSGNNPNATLDPTTNELTIPNTDADKELTVTAKNESGVSISPLDKNAVTVTFTNKYGTFKYTGTKANTSGITPAVGTDKYSFACAASYAEWELTLTPKEGTWFSKLGYRPVVAIEAEDWAESNGKGNIDPNPAQVAVLNKDTDSPSVTHSYSEDASRINGIYSITGTSSDTTSNPETLTLYYSKTTAKPSKFSDYQVLKSISTTGPDKVNVSKLTNYSFDVNFDNYITDDAETQDIWLLVVATDQAGNTSVDKNQVPGTIDESLVSAAAKKYVIDRNTDRPTVTISEIELNTEMSSSDYTKLYLGSKQIFINVSDDDGVEKAEYRTTKEGGAPSETGENGWKEITLKGSSGNFKLSSDGPQSIEFKITDINDTVFTSSSTPDWKKIYVEDAHNHKFGDYKDNTHTEVTAPVIYATLDTENPSVELIGITVDEVVAADSDATGWVLPANFNKTLGGASKNVWLKIKASDTGSGIDSVEANSVSTDTLTNDVCILKVPCSTGDGIFSLTITAKDKAGRTNQIVKQFNIDNTPPEIHVESPDSTSEQSGNGTVSAFGYFTESVKLSYTVSPIMTDPDHYEDSTVFNFTKNGSVNTTALPVNDKAGVAIIPAGYTSATIANYLKRLCVYKDYSTDKVSTFNIFFDGGNESAAHTDMLNTWLTNMQITTPADLAETDPAKWFDDVITLYLQLRAEDEAGNVSYKAYPILVDPQGNRPKVDFSYPTEKMNNTTLNPVGPILGGTIDIRGTAIGVNQVEKIYMQIDTDGDGDWDSDDEAYLTGNGKNNYTLVDIPGKTGEKGIEISVSGTFWNQKININEEFDPSEKGQQKRINIRLYAKDSQGLMSSAKTKWIYFDNDIPVIGQDKWLVQWNTGFSITNGLTVKNDSQGKEYIEFANGAVKAQREYTDEMYLSGEWYLVGMVSDDSGISIINIDGTKNSDGHTNLTSDTTKVKAFTENGHENYVFCLPIGASSGVVKSNIQFYAKDNDNGDKFVEKNFIVYSDNLPPEVTELSDDPVFNDNGFYTFGSVSTENSAGSVNQSGVERIAFYFTREAIGTQGAAGYIPAKLFDPMMKSGVTGNAVNLGDYTLDNTDGLYWKTVSADVNGKVVTLNAAQINVHKLGLVKVNGTIYRIESINDAGTILTLSGPAGTASSVQFTIANVIDNTSQEDVVTKNLRKSEYGYGYPPAKNEAGKTVFDDGDLMPEYCKKVGTQCTWKASINSKNISDGKVTLHYVVFDKAGNANIKTVNKKVQNNSPRIAGVLIGTDENGNGNVDAGEFTDTYHNINPKGLVNGSSKAVNVEITAKAKNGNNFQIKRKTVIRPEIIGGNGTLYYNYKVEGYSFTSDIVELGEGNGESETVVKGLNDIELDVIEFLTRGITTGTDKKFSFTVWDSTPGLTPGIDSQSATLHLIMDAAIEDTTPATDKIIPFYWKSKSKNSLADNSLEKGHIELSKDLPSETFTPGGSGIYTLNPKVSGAIKLEGIAQDNSLLKELKVAISTYKSGNAVSIATYSNGTWDEKSGTGWSSKIEQATYGQLVAAGYITDADIPEDCDEDSEVPYASQELGHVVHWTMTIDTEAMGITPAAGIQITASAIDYGWPEKNDNVVEYNNPTSFDNNGDGDSPAQTGGDDGTEAHTCKYFVDVVPYIRGIKTVLSKQSSNKDSSEKDRTALGHYPVASTEILYVYGFNLKDGTLYDKENHTAVLSTAIQADTVAALKDFDSYKGFTLYPTAANAISNFTSGEITVKYVTGDDAIESLNNKNFNNARGEYGGESFTLPAASNYGKRTTKNTFSNFYNRMPNSENNYILTDDVVLDVWNINNQAGTPTAGGRIDELTMKINPAADSGTVGFAFLDGPKHFSRPKGKTTSYSTGKQNYGNQDDSHTTAALAYDTKGNAFALNAGGNEGDAVHFEILPAGGGNSTNVYIEYVNQLTKRDGTGSYVDLRYKVKSPNIVTSPNGTNDTNIYMVYYDSYNNEIRYKYGSMTNILNGFKNNKKDGGDLFHTRNNNEQRWPSDNPYTCEYSQVIATSEGNLPADKSYSATYPRLGGAGEYVDIAVIPKGTTLNNNTKLTEDVVVVVWDDGGNLKYTYNTNPRDYSWHANDDTYCGLNSKNWAPAKTLFTGASEYCQVKVDGNGGIHIAAYDRADGDLKYTYLSTYNKYDSSSYNEKTMSYTVDSSGATGSHMRMDVGIDSTGKAVPYITYWGSNMPKIAYLNAATAADGTVNDMFNGNWEVSYIPTSSAIDDLDNKKDIMNVDNRINVGVWKTLASNDSNGGVIKNSVTGTDASNAAGNGKIYGNGKSYPMVSYSVLAPNDTANSRIETAQMQ